MEKTSTKSFKQKIISMAFLPRQLNGKESACQFRIQVQPLVQEDPQEKGMKTYSKICA